MADIGVERTTGRDAGLKRALGPWSLCANVLNIVVGAGIFVLPAALYRDAGAATPWAYLICTAVMGGVAVCFAAGGSRAPTSGGPYGPAEAAFGPLAGFLSGFLIWVSDVLAGAAIVAGVADLTARLAPTLAAPLPHAIFIVLILAVPGAVNVAGVAWGGGLVRLATTLKLLPLLVFPLAAAIFMLHPPPAPPAAAAPASTEGFGRAMLLAIFAFSGMESALSVSGEVRNPSRNVPLGLLSAMAGVAVLYVTLQLATQRLLGPALATSAAPLADAARVIWPPLGALLLAGTAASAIGYLAGNALSSPRLLFAFSREGLAPRFLSQLSSRTAVPVWALVVHLALTAAVAASGGFEQLVVLSTLAVVPVYAIGCVAAVVLQRRGLAQAGAPFHVPGLWAVAAVGLLGMGWLVLNGKPAELLGLAGVMTTAAAIYAVARGRRVRPA